MARTDAVHGIHCPTVRPTRAAALLLASVLSAPVFLILNLINWLFL